MMRKRHEPPHSHPIRTVLMCAALCVAACMATFTSGCEDRLPAQALGPGPSDTSDNMFVLDGDGYQGAVFSFPRRSAIAYHFTDNDMTSILNAERITGPGGRQVQAVVHITVPGLASGSFPWKDGTVDPTPMNKVRIAIDSVEYVSVSGSTQVFYTLDPVSRKVRGGYSGILESGAGKQVRLSSGRFDGGFF
ncbi:MAG: hypothetical protein IPP94_15305 [Ignavibacteria bacterium]|nr:hypothetical protein [Ignavibacteria bacterium]